jgi:hypothetical protein
MEGEHFSSSAARASHSWQQVNDSTASGGQAMEATPNNGASINTGYSTGSPELAYQVNFTTTGTYYVWVRGSGAETADRTVHAGIDGTGPASADRMSGFTSALSWKKSTLDGPVATIVVSSPGLHTVNLWMREDGFRVDKVLLTTNSGFTPSGAGPAESPRTGSGSNPCAGICSNPVNFSGNFQSGNLGTAATCHQTTTLNGGNCGNFVSPRTLSINGTVMTCNNQNWSSLPPKVNGGYCVTTTAGNQPWAYFATW